MWMRTSLTFDRFNSVRFAAIATQSPKVNIGFAYSSNVYNRIRVSCALRSIGFSGNFWICGLARATSETLQLRRIVGFFETRRRTLGKFWQLKSNSSRSTTWFGSLVANELLDMSKASISNHPKGKGLTELPPTVACGYSGIRSGRIATDFSIIYIFSFIGVQTETIIHNRF